MASAVEMEEKMFYREIELQIPYEKAGIVHSDYRAKLYAYVQEETDSIAVSHRRPAVIVCPGGGYAFTSDREAEPVALKYAAMGYHAFVLRYSVSPDVFPAPQLELAQAIYLVREHADEWHVNPDKIVVTGFSAGGHLAASLACLWNREELYGPLGRKAEDIRPNGAILCYPVISSGPFAHRDSFVKLLGDRYEELVDEMSLENQVGPHVPPVFIWHTVADELVPVENTLFFIQALQKHHVPFEAHLYPEGKHGLSLADPLTSTDESQLLPHIADWISLAEKWLRQLHPAG